MEEADLAGVREAVSWHQPQLRGALLAGQRAAGRGGLWWGIAGLAAATGSTRTRFWAAQSMAAMLTAQVLSNGIGKQLIYRRRPPGELLRLEDLEDRPRSSSFPSGHTAAAVAFAATTLAHSRSWGTATTLAATAVAVARVHTGAHYPTDIAAGAATGLTAALLVHHAARTLPRLLHAAAR